MRIERHMEPCSWHQGDVQRILPREVLFTAWRDIVAENVSHDFNSPLSPLGRETLYVPDDSHLSKVDGFSNNTSVASDKKCGSFPLLKTLRNCWHEIGGALYTLIRKAGDRSVIGFICPQRHTESAAVLSHMQSCLVHGFSDQRDRPKCAYMLLNTQVFSDPVFRYSLGFQVFSEPQPASGGLLAISVHCSRTKRLRVRLCGRIQQPEFSGVRNDALASRLQGQLRMKHHRRYERRHVEELSSMHIQESRYVRLSPDGRQTLPLD
jgi:hypothetical protein